MASIGLLTLHLHIEDAQSLKDKRQVLRPLKERLRKRFNVSVAELDFQDSWQSSLIGVVTISPSESFARKVLESVEREASRMLAADLRSSDIEFL